MSKAGNLLDAAEAVAGLLLRHRIKAVVIGAVALAAHRHIRYTEDLDLGVNTDLVSLRAMVEALAEEGFDAVLREPDAQDPLGGVIDVSGSFGLVQIINFGDRFPAVIDDAIQSAVLAPRQGSLLRLAPIAHLIVLKLYAGGHKSKADIMELIQRNPDLDLTEVCALCNRYRLAGLEEILGELGEDAPGF